MAGDKFPASFFSLQFSLLIMIPLLLPTRITASVVGESSSQAANYHCSSLNKSLSSLDCVASDEWTRSEKSELGKMQKVTVVI